MLKRWKATATYKAGNGSSATHVHEFDELEDLDELIEAGPDWTTLDKIVILYNMNVEDVEVVKPALTGGNVDKSHGRQ